MKVTYEKRQRVAIITINRPEVLNVIDPETSDSLYQSFQDFQDDRNLWVAILTGAGERAFSAGADLKAVDRGQRHRVFGGITGECNVWKPIIAAINGLTLGGGLEIALACDLRIAVDSAVFGLPEARWCLAPGAGGLIRLPRIIPIGKALELILMGRQLTAQEALEVGLVNKVVARDKLLPTASEWAAQICELAPLAIQAAKECVYRSMNVGLAEALKVDDDLTARLRETLDFQEGMQAFKEKRKPDFQGK